MEAQIGTNPFVDVWRELVTMFKSYPISQTVGKLSFYQANFPKTGGYLAGGHSYLLRTHVPFLELIMGGHRGSVSYASAGVSSSHD